MLSVTIKANMLIVNKLSVMAPRSGFFLISASALTEREEKEKEEIGENSVN
jgi:hypothetical protein